MKRFLLILAAVAMLGLATTALAGDHQMKSTAAKATESAKQVKAATKGLGECCVKAAKAGEGCCGKDAETVQAAYKAQRAHEMVNAEMHACCVASLAKAEGCCGKDAAGLKADYTAKMTEATAKITALDGMHSCCAEAVQAGKGCCGKDAAALESAYEKAVEKVRKDVASR